MKKPRFAFLVLVALCLAGPAERGSAQTPGAPAPKTAPTTAPKAPPNPAPKQPSDWEKIYREMRGEWRRTGPGFACVVTSPQQPPPSERMAEALYFACLHMGPLVIRGSADTLKALGAPSRTLPQPNGATASVYLLEPPWPTPYLVATVLNDRIVALQISGPNRTKNFSFNNVNLGDSIDTLLKHFSTPRHIGPSGRKEAELWEYKPWTFTFEIENDRVTSIRIADPAY